MNDEKLLKKALRSIKTRAGKRAVVMYGRHVVIQQALEDNGVKIKKIFTNNKELLEDKSLKCVNAAKLDGAAKRYFVVIPFFLDDGGEGQRNTMRAFGFRENKDYIFYPNENDDSILSESDIDDIRADLLVLHTQIEETQKLLNEMKKTEELRDAQYKQLLWHTMAGKDGTVLDAKKRFFMAIPHTEGMLRRVQLAGVILLTKFDEVCRANDIPYWISFGTLLGAVRHQSFIPWDDDTDVCMMREGAEKLTKLLENDKDFYVSHIFAEFEDNLNHCVQLKYRREGTPYCLDIFIYDYCDDISLENIENQMALNAEMAEEAQTIRKSYLSKEQKEEHYSQLLNKYLEKSRKTVGTTTEPSKYMIWALDNYRCAPYFQSNCAVSDVFPLKPMMFEGKEFMAPCNPEKYLRGKYGDIYRLPGDMLSHAHFRLNEHQEAVLAEILKKFADMLSEGNKD